MRALIACLAVALAAPALALAPGLDAAQSAYDDGRFAEAAALAGEGSRAEAHELAAAAQLARLMTRAEGVDRPEAARRVRDHARAALRANGESADAHLRMAAALGYLGRYTSPFMAYLRGLPQRGRDHIETAIRLDPDDPWGHAMLGAWHLEVVRRGGEGTLGASMDEGLARYAAAVRMAEDEPGIPYHFALALVAADPHAHGERAEALLERAVAAEPEDAFAEAMIDQARSLLARLRDDPAAAQAEAVDRLER